jgi:chaperonin cofactor prefoldin
MADFVTLSCPACGGKLEITNDVERFACAHCGQEHIVRRSGGIISLSPVVDAIKQVGIGVDKTAAELALARLQKELDSLQIQRNYVYSQYKVVNGYLLIFLVLLMIGGSCSTLWSIVFIITNVRPLASNLPMLIIGIVALTIGIILISTKSKDAKKANESIRIQINSLDNEIAQKNSEIKHLRDLVST